MSGLGLKLSRLDLLLQVDRRHHGTGIKVTQVDPLVGGPGDGQASPFQAAGPQ